MKGGREVSEPAHPNPRAGVPLGLDLALCVVGGSSQEGVGWSFCPPLPPLLSEHLAWAEVGGSGPPAQDCSLESLL